MGKAITAMSDAMFKTDCAKATFSRHTVVPVLSGLHGPPTMVHNTRVYANMDTATATTIQRYMTEGLIRNKTDTMAIFVMAGQIK
jgi:NADH:ubiquinone oxidoreductase subunit F (NADH-binding)